MIILVTQLDNDDWTDCEIVLAVILTIFSKLIPLLVFHDVQVICGIVIEQRDKSVLAVFNVDGGWSRQERECTSTARFNAPTMPIRDDSLTLR